MYTGIGAWGVLAGAVGGVLILLSVILANRLGVRRAAAVAGGGMILLGLSMAGIIDVIARLTFSPIRWVGLGAAILGAVMLSWSGVLPGKRRTAEKAATGEDTRELPAERKPAADEDIGDIEDILRRHGIE